MSARAAVPFTAVSGRILFHGLEVGEIQNINVNENNNYRRVQGIGSPIEVIHVPGVYMGDLSAQRVYLEADLLLSLLNPVSELHMPKTLAVGRGRLIQAPITREQLAQGIVNSKGIVNIYEKVVNVYFDIQILNSADHPIMNLHDCSIVSRSISMNIGAVLTMENIQMFYRYKSYGNDPLGTEELAPALVGAVATPQ